MDNLLDLYGDYLVSMPIKANRKVALGLADKQQGRHVRVDTLEPEPNIICTVYSEGVDSLLLLVKSS